MTEDCITGYTNAHQNKPVINSLIEYVVRSSTLNSDLVPLKDLLRSDSSARIGLVLTERLVNIPSEVVPPMYKMLLEEISWAVEEKEPYSFTHYLILSKTYKEIDSQLDQGLSKSEKKQKKQKITSSRKDQYEVFYFHPEDEVLQRHASAYGGFEYVKQEAEGQPDSRRAFQDLGIKPQGHMILIEAAKFEAAVKAMGQYFQHT